MEEAAAVVTTIARAGVVVTVVVVTAEEVVVVTVQEVVVLTGVGPRTIARVEVVVVMEVAAEGVATGVAVAVAVAEEDPALVTGGAAVKMPTRLLKVVKTSSGWALLPSRRAASGFSEALVVGSVKHFRRLLHGGC